MRKQPIKNVIRYAMVISKLPRYILGINILVSRFIVYINLSSYISISMYLYRYKYAVQHRHNYIINYGSLQTFLV